MAVIQDNTFRFLGTAVEADLQHDSDLELYLTGNDFTALGIGLFLTANSSFNIEVEAHDNFFWEVLVGLDNNLFPDGFSPSSFALNASGNTFVDSVVGINTIAGPSGSAGLEAYTHTSNISDNDFASNNIDYALQVLGNGLDLPGEVDVDVTVQNNRSVEGDFFGDIETVGVVAAANGAGIVPEGSFVGIHVDPIPDGHIDIDIVDNQVLGSFASPINVNVVLGPDVDATISRNEILGAFGDAINLAILASGDEDGHDVRINDNIITAAGEEGIEVFIGDSLNSDLTISRNHLSLVQGFGILGLFDDVGLLPDGDGDNTITIEGNILENIGWTGIDFTAFDGDDTAVTVVDNRVSFVGFGDLIGTGIEVGMFGVGDLAGEGNEITVNRNTVEFTQGIGIDVNVADSFFGPSDNTAVTVSNNNLRFIESLGINVTMLAVGHGGENAIAIDQNTLDHVRLGGVRVSAALNDATTLGMVGNDISTVLFGSGITVDFDENLDQTIMINGGNNVEFAAGHGIAVDVDGFVPGDTEVAVANNTVEHVGLSGIDINFRGVVEGEMTVLNNVVDGSDWAGIDIDLDEDAGFLGSGGNEVNIAGNLVSNTLFHGIDLVIDDDSDLNLVTIASNEVSHGEWDGVWVSIRDGSDGNEVTVASNQIFDHQLHGVDSFIWDGADLNVLTVRNNQITESGFHGLEFLVGDVGDLTTSNGNILVADTNTISRSGLNGIDVDILGGVVDATSLVIGGNSIDLSGVNGIDIVAPFLPNLIDLSSEINGAERNNIVTNFGVADALFVGDFNGTLLVNGTLVP
jgi:hypothetical protein